MSYSRLVLENSTFFVLYAEMLGLPTQPTLCGALPTRPQAAGKSDEERLPEISGSLCVADKRDGLKAQAGADAEAVRAVGGRIEMDAGMVVGRGFGMVVAVVGTEGQRQIRGKLFLRIHTQS